MTPTTPDKPLQRICLRRARIRCAHGRPLHAAVRRPRQSRTAYVAFHPSSLYLYKEVPVMLALEAGDDLLWFWIGSHSEYDKLVD